MRYSVVVPVHNEAAHLEALTARFLGALPPEVTTVLHEVILVENGSTDDTLAACQRLRLAYPGVVRVVSNARGSYGEAIKRGMMESTGSHLSILECDCLLGEFVLESIAWFKDKGARFIVASKRHPDSVDGRPFKRRLLSRLFNYVLNVSVGYPGSDTHGLKSIEAGLAKELCALAETTDEIFQTELVLIAWRKGVRIDELPIRITEVRATPVSIRRRLPMVLDMVRALRRSLRRFPRLGGA
jgi:glycosyltransferase involved in cell wall biosynthesis